MNQQGELDFSNCSLGSGLDRWREERRQAQRELACRLGLPLGHHVEVWLLDGVRLNGRLELAEQLLFVEEIAAPELRLMVEGIVFQPGDIESCVRNGG